MITPSKAMIAGDWHGNTRHAVAAIRWAAEQGAECIVHTGDFGFNFEKRYVEAIEAESYENDLPVYFVRGNHDNTEYLRNLPKNSDGTGRVTDNISWITQGMRWQWGSKTWMGLGGAVSVDRNSRTEYQSWWSDETISMADGYKAIEGGGVDVMITHDCPDNVDIPGITKDNNSYWPEDAIRESNAHRALLGEVVNVVQPKILFHGHYHTRYSFVRKFSAFGGGETEIVGLDMDGMPMRDNMILVDVT